MSKIILVECELRGGKGHHYDHLVENSFYYKNSGDIFWILNKDFKKENLYIPEYVTVHNIIDTGNRKLLIQNPKNILKVLYLSVKNFILSYFFLITNLKINKSFLKYIFKNYFTFPKYFSSFYKIFRKLNLNKNDKIIFQTSRINEIELAYILLLLNLDVEIHLRIIQLHRKKKLSKINKLFMDFHQNDDLFRKVFIYTETDYQKDQIKKLTNIDVELFYNNLTFSEKSLEKNNYTIGILGESRLDKGFYKIPDLIKNLNSKILDKINFIIQINNCPENLSYIKNEIKELSIKYNNIKIINGYINFFEYRELLKKIDIIPLLHELDQLKYCGSGIVFSSMVNEIPMIIPKGATYVKNFFAYQSFVEAENINDYTTCIIKIVDNYKKFLEETKKQSSFYKKKLINDPLNNRIM